MEKKAEKTAFEKAQSAKKDKKPDILEPYLMAGETIKDTYEIFRFLNKYVIYLTNYRIIKLRRDVFGLSYFKDIHYRYLNSISVGKMRDKTWLYIFLVVVGLAMSSVLYRKLLGYISFLPRFSTAQYEPILAITALALLMIYLAGRKKIIFTSFNTKMKIPYQERLVKEAREYQHIFSRKK